MLGERRTWHTSDKVILFPIIGLSALLPLILLINDIIRQRPQYSLKAILILTFLVAVLCSIYKCFGFDGVFAVILSVYLVVPIYAYLRNRHKK